MKTILLENIDLNPIRDEMNEHEGDSFETPVSVLRGKLEEFSSSLTQKTELKPIVDTIAFQTFSVWAIEFFKNALDANASKLTLEFKFDETAKQVEIDIRDNGTIPIPSDKCGEFRWETPFEAASPKASKKTGDSAQMGGAHLGLARFAHVLEKYCDNGKITLNQREDQPGAEITLKGSATRWEKDVQDEDFNAQYMREMGTDFSAKPGATSTTTKVTERLKGDVTGLGHLSSSNEPSPELASPPSIRGRKTPSSTTIQTPTIQPWSPVSPYMAEQPSKHVDPNAEQPSKHTDPNAALPHTQSFNFFSPKKREKKNLLHPSPKESPSKPKV